MTWREDGATGGGGGGGGEQWMLGNGKTGPNLQVSTKMWFLESAHEKVPRYQRLDMGWERTDRWMDRPTKKIDIYWGGCPHVKIDMDNIDKYKNKNFYDRSYTKCNHV